jgi:hypothetical protein
MLGHPLKNTLAALGLFAAIVAGSTGAHAFTETQSPPPAAAQPAPQGQAAPLQIQKPEDGAGLSLNSPGDAKSGGTELNIPGVGKIGNLPKLDFGLELLYGGGNGPNPQNPATEQNDDVLIKGTIKHRF